MVQGREGASPTNVNQLRFPDSEITNPRTRLWSHWWVIRAFIPAHNAITYGCSLKMSTKRVVSFVKKKVSVKSQELYSMLVKNCKNNDAMPPCCNFHNIPFLRQVISSSPKQILSRLGKHLFAKSKVHSL